MIYVVGISILLQVIAAIVALRLIRLTGARSAWLLIAAAMGLMIARRCFTLYHTAIGDGVVLSGTAHEALGLAVSLAMVLGLLGVEPLFRKLAESRQMEQSLRETEARFRATFEQAAVGIALVDLNGRWLQVNRRLCEIVGYEHGELLGKTFQEITHKDDLEADLTQLESLRRGDLETYSMEKRYHHKAGYIVWVNLTVSAERDQRGSIAFYIAVVEDISLRKQVEQSLQMQSRVLESMTEGVSLSDENGIIRYTNPAEDAIFGYERGELIGKHVTVQNSYPLEENERIVASVIEELRTKGVWTGEWRNRKKDGTPFTTLARITMLELEGQPHFVCVQADVTQQKEAQLALAASEESLRLALASGRMGSWQWNVRTGAVSWSDNLEAIHGLAPGSFGGTLDSFNELVYPDDRQLLADTIARSLEARSEYEIEFRNVRQDGSIGWILGKGQVFVGSDGQPERVVGVAMDITERKRAEEALRQSEGQFRRAVVNAPIPIMMHTENGEILQLSKAWTELSGFTPEDIPTVDHWLERAFDDHTRPRARSLFACFTQNEAPHEGELEIRTASGSRRVWHFTISAPGHLQDGRQFLASMATDVTDRRRSEESARFLADVSAALAALEDYQPTLEHVAQLAVPYFADWCGVDLKQSDGTLARLAVQHIDPSKIELAKELHRRFPPDPDSPHGILAVIRSGNPVLVPVITDEMLVAAIQEPERLALVRELGLRSYLCVPLKARGETIGALTFAMAESGRVLTAQELSLAQDLAGRATIAIENARLYQELREADRRKDEFLAMLAHELRNPLAPISNALYILGLQPAQSASAEQARAMMERQVQHMVRLVDDLLDVSRIMRGKIELQKETIILNDVVSRAIETVQPVIDGLGHRLQVSLPDPPVRIKVDPVRMSQVLANLLNNAAKYTERGGQIWLDGEAHNGEVHLRVRDSGIGIEPGMLRHIFELFAQADHSRQRAHGGLGIGLTLVRRLVELHGGTVEAQSNGLGQGSEFSVRLPRAVDKGRNVDRRESPAAESATGKRRVLVVDDNIDSANTLAMLLRMTGNQVEVAYDGLAALETFETSQLEVVILDLGMPGLDGYETARRLRTLPGGDTVLLAALTGWGQEDDRRRTEEAGFDLHLVKPVKLQDLQTLLDHPKLVMQ